MARTRRTAHKSTGRLPVGQLAPRNVPQPQESQPDIPQEATPEEEPFETELVVPESPTAQDSPAEEQQPEDPGTEDKTDEEQPPPSDTEPEKLYRDADEMESFGAESPILTDRLQALLEHLGITTAPRYRIKEVPRYRKKDQFKAYGVKKDIPRMLMVHHQDVAVELSTRLLTAKHEIETLRAQL
jgi:hypothetical protein